ncbi:hypothetical protein QLG12_10055 [Pseudomonas sp. V88_4]|uniref:hypothetical protein n=1 Tax=Pseudomonas sp. V88_4 TaxID=3044229 RepID=UPI00249DFFC4|nr:hypothetical protein [Pseudomonas sp. V88_4]MDI3398546.1 hypothetical protein [Pseudomonas sp. V88_4]
MTLDQSCVMETLCTDLNVEPCASPIHLIRFFLSDLHLYPSQPRAQNSPAVRPYATRFIPKRPVRRTFSIQEAFMAKMAIFLGGFLVLTIMIGVLATISPV